jgi:MoxR-like ATPase
VQQAASTIGRLCETLGRVIRGKERQIRDLVVAVLAGGHVLIEDVPGVGKTTLAKALVRSIGGSFRRIQFTPDLLPTDILGGAIYRPADGTFEIREGPIFANVVLADEINRASPRTQSALLEAMSESAVTLDGVPHPLPEPFLVIATENPIEFHGTYPLPEAQVDRFLIRLRLGYPPAAEEEAMLYQQQTEHPLERVPEIITPEDLRELQAQARQVQVSAPVGRYIRQLVAATREEPRCELGCSPRASLGLFRCAQARALAEGRDHALPEDVQRMAEVTLAHRLVLETKARYGGVDKGEVIRDVVSRVPVEV